MQVVDPQGLADVEHELLWRFRQSDGALGFRGQNVDPDHVGGVFDALASQRAHLARRTPSHRASVQRRGLIDRALCSVTREHRRTLRLTFEPRPYPTTSDLDASRLRLAFRRARSNVSLLPLILETRELREAWASHVHEQAEKAGRGLDATPLPSVRDLVRALEWEVGTSIASGKLAELSPWAERARGKAENRLVGALRAYSLAASDEAAEVERDAARAAQLRSARNELIMRGAHV